MNRTYKLVWNVVQQGWVVASELGKSRKKSKAVGLMLAVAALGVGHVAVAAPASRAIPVLDNFASGSSATITVGTAGDGRTLLTIDQTSDKLIANWTSFEVGQFSRVLFNQPTVSSVALNRIAGTAPSQIFGQVQANGQLILVNPAGIVFGPSARVNAASVIASTLNITDANFNTGVLQFDRGTSTGTIDIQKQGDNQGIIMAENGNTFVFAPTVTNSGTVRAQAGNVTIANGNRLTVDATAGTATLNQVSGIAGLIQSTGVIRGDRLTTTDKGKVFIVGDRARTGSIVNLSGEITSTGNDIKVKDLNITGDLVVNSNTNINSIKSININGVFSVSGNNRLISVDYDNGNAGDDYLYFGDAGKISMIGSGNTFREKGVTYNIIASLAQLQAIGTDATTLAGKYVLGVDIDASSSANVNTPFTPIGSTESAPFTGTINGLGNHIKDLTINAPSSDAVGLFGYAKNSTIKSIYLENVNIAGQENVGALLGKNISNASAVGGSYIYNNRASGTVTGNLNVGGLIGLDQVYNGNTSAIQYNASNAQVTVTSGVDSEYGTNAGGIVGFVDENTAGVSKINNNIWYGSVSGVSNIGGIVGQAQSSSSINQDTTVADLAINNNTTNGSVSGSTNVGGIAGYINNSNAVVEINNNLTTGVTQASSINVVKTAIGGLAGKIRNASKGKITLNGNLVNGIVSVPQELTFESKEIGGAVGWLDISGDTTNCLEECNEATVNINGVDTNVYDKINTINIDMTTTGNVVANKSVNVGGLIGRIQGYASFNAIIKGVTLGDVSGKKYVGGLIGLSDADTKIGNEEGKYYFSLKVVNSSSSGVINGVDRVGGLIGNYKADYIYSNGSMVSKNSVQDSYATGFVSSSAGIAGGLIGEAVNVGLIKNSYANGTVSYGSDESNVGGLIGDFKLSSAVSSIFDNVHASGDVTGSTDVGGLLGYVSLGTDSNLSINKSFASGDVAGRYAVGGLIGYMQVQNNAIFNLDKSYASGNKISNQQYPNNQGFGGLIGYLDNFSDVTVSNSYAIGSLMNIASQGIGGFIGYMTPQNNSKLYINNSYASGQFSQNLGSNKGGVIGYIGTSNPNPVYFDKVYWSNTSCAVGSGSSSSGCITTPANSSGILTSSFLTDTASKQMASYSGWDISNQLTGSNSIWYINEGVSTPVLRALMTP